MFNLPFFNYPYNYSYYRNYNRYNNYAKSHTSNYSTNTNACASNTNNTSFNENHSTTSNFAHNSYPLQQEPKNSITNSDKISNTINSRLSSSSNNDQAIFEILGIKLYLDDLIILGLLFFLYQQQVKDEMLYIILFMLLFA